LIANSNTDPFPLLNNFLIFSTALDASFHQLSRLTLLNLTKALLNSRSENNFVGE
jgi:hypothetical protein